MERYQTISWLLKYKRWLAPAAGILVLLAGIYLTIRLGAPDFAIFGLILGVVIYGVVRSYLELVDVIAEMLLPR